MKVAISAAGPALDDEVDPRFGRCRYFIIADVETMDFEVMDNSSAMAAGGAGISAAQTIAGKAVEAVLTGNCGPNAYQVLSSAGIQVVTGVSGRVIDAIQGYRSGKFKGSEQANVPDHFGMSAAVDTRPGSATGQGTGRGRGMGQGMGRDRGYGVTAMINPSSYSQSPEQEMKDLKAQTEVMSQQLDSIQRRINKLEEGSK